MKGKIFFVTVALIVAGYVGYLILDFPIYPAFQYPVERMEDLKEVYPDHVGLLFPDLASFNLHQTGYFVKLDGRSRISKKIGYTISGNQSLLGSEALFSLTCRKSEDGKDGIRTDHAVNYRDYTIYTEVFEKRVTATVWLGGYQYQSKITSPIPFVLSAEVQLSATECALDLTKNLVDAQYENEKIEQGDEL